MSGPVTAVLIDVDRANLTASHRQADEAADAQLVMRGSSPAHASSPRDAQPGGPRTFWLSHVHVLSWYHLLHPWMMALTAALSPDKQAWCGRMVIPSPFPPHLM